MKNRKHGCVCILLCALILLLSACTSLPEIPEVPETTVSPLPLSTVEPKAFETLENGWITYPDAMQGIDVSSHQGEIDWAAVKDAGIEFAILQIGYRGYTEGTLNPDVRFEENLRGAQANGIQVGVYFYSQALTVEEAEEEARFTLDAIGGRALDLPVYFDWEEVQTGRTGGKATYSITSYAEAFCKAIAAEGYQAGIYFNQMYAYRLLDLARLMDYSFWLAEYNPVPSYLYAVNVWQYSGQGSVPGIDEKVDMNLMYK